MDEAQELYELILTRANQFLRNARMFEIKVLQDHNPTYEELAKIMHKVAALIYELADDEDPMLAQKSAEYVFIMQKMAIAIREGQQDKLLELAEEMGRKPGL